MSLTSCTIHFTRQPGKSIYMSRLLLRQLQLSPQTTVSLKIGSKRVATTLRQIKQQGKHIYIPESIRNLLKIPRAGNCMIKTSGREIKLGPLIGILTSAGIRGNQVFGARTALIRQFLHSGTNRSFYFAFTPRGINWQQETVTGYFPGPGGTWIRKTVPLPDAIYNRLPDRRAEFSPGMENFKEQFVNRNIPIFNWSFFNKSDVYQLLQGEPESQYVPESSENPPAAKIKDMLERHQFVYLKPTGGSLGKGIFRLTYHPKRGYFCRYRRNGRNVLLRFGRFPSLMRMLRSQSRLSHYVVQQGIRLIEIDNCPIDFRFHMNKNGKNQWVAAGIGAKKAGRGSVTTHIRTGGQLMTPEAALSRIFGSRATDILEKAKAVAVTLCEAIERKYRRRIGEIGFDIGIDKNENIWMFEANAKPGRSIFKHPALKTQGKDTVEYVYQHLLYLSKFIAKEEA